MLRIVFARRRSGEKKPALPTFGHTARYSTTTRPFAMTSPNAVPIRFQFRVINEGSYWQSMLLTIPICYTKIQEMMMMMLKKRHNHNLALHPTAVATPPQPELRNHVVIILYICTYTAPSTQ